MTRGMSNDHILQMEILKPRIQVGNERARASWQRELGSNWGATDSLLLNK